MTETRSHARSVAPVIIVGAGPAGCAAALALRRRNVDVLLLERAWFPRDKVCGDVLLPEARQALSELGVDLAPLAARCHRIDRCCYHGPSGRSVELPFCDLAGVVQPWWAIARTEFDAQLATLTRAAGVELREGVTAIDVVLRDAAVRGVVVRQASGEREELPAAAVIAADGATSAIARALGRFERPAEHLCVSVRGYAASPRGDSSVFDIYTTDRTLPGCAWHVPAGHGRANVGLGVLRRDLDQRQVGARALLAEVAAHYPDLQRDLAATSDVVGWSLPGGSLPLSHATTGALLIGDAGSMVDPFTGHGIHTALIAGQLAAEVLADALAAGDVGADALGRFDRLWQQRFGQEMWLGWLLQRFCASPGRVGAMLALTARSDQRRQLIGGLIGHAYPRQRWLDPLLGLRFMTGR